MSVFTVSLSNFLGCRPISPKYVTSIRGEFKVGRVAAGSILAQVVKYGYVPTFTFRDWRNQPCIHKPVNSIQNFVYPNLPVPTAKNARPNPAPANVIYNYFSENPFLGLWRHATDFEQSVVHDTSILYGDLHA